MTFKSYLREYLFLLTSSCLYVYMYIHLSVFFLSIYLYISNYLSIYSSIFLYACKRVYVCMKKHMHSFIRYHKWKYIKENIYSNIKVLLHELLFFAARKKQVRDCLKYFVFDKNVCICANTTGIQCSENTTPAGGVKSHKANLQEEIRTG